MSIFFQRTLLYLVIALVERSFLSVLFPGVTAPILMIVLVMSIVIILSFEKGWPWVLLAALMYELSGSGAPSLFLPLSILFAYGASFLSKRFILEHRLSGLITLGAMAGIMAFPFVVIPALLGGAVPSLSELVTLFLLGMLVFPVVSSCVSWWEKRLAFSHMAEFRGLSTR